jgi:hypothetical protein
MEKIIELVVFYNLDYSICRLAFMLVWSGCKHKK